MAALLACGSRALRASARRSPLALQIRAFASSDPTVPKLPELPYDYGDLEPVISAEIMKLHHQKHHQAYINGYMQAKEKYEAAQEKGNLETMIALQPAIRFNGGGHVNHSIFWKNLCPPKEYAPPEGKLADKIEADFGSLDKLQSKMSTTAAGVQGSGWGWLGYNKDTDKLVIATTANQDPLTTLGLTPLLGIDVWEHAYYLQYKNVRPDYLKNIWKVVNWKDVSSRLPA